MATKRLLVFALIVLLVSGLLSAYFYSRADKVIPKEETTLKETVNFLNDDTTTYDIIFIGSSRIWVHIDPRIIDSMMGVNSRCVAIDGSTISEQFILLKKYIQHHRAPKMIVLGMDYSTLEGRHLPYDYPDYYEFMDDTAFSSILKRVNFHFQYNFFFSRYDGFIQKSARTDYQKFAMTSSALGLSRKFENLSDEPSWLKEVATYKGYAGLNRKWSAQADNELRTKINVTYDDLGVELFKNFIVTSKSYAAHTITMFPPVYSGLEKNASIDKYYAEVSRIAGEQNVPFWNYTSDTLCGAKKYFYNAWHLNQTGAELFTRTVATDIKTYLEKQ